jgi:hypothetical protein
MELKNRLTKLEQRAGAGIAGDEKMSTAAWESLCVGYGPEILPEQNRARAAKEEPPAWSEVLAVIERIYGEPSAGGEGDGQSKQ